MSEVALNSARRFKNPKGDWLKLEKTLKEADNYTRVIEELADDLMKAHKKLTELKLEAFNLCPETDALYLESPVSPYQQTLHLKLYLKKLGWDGIRDIYVATASIRNFTDYTKEALSWLLKFKPKTK